MAEPYHVTLIARVTVSVEASDSKQAEQIALAQARSRQPGMPWAVEHVEVPWGT